MKKNLKAIITVLVLTVLGSQLYAQTKPKSVTEARQKLISFSLKMEGLPYIWGGTDPKKGLDCSSFVDYCVHSVLAGIKLPDPYETILGEYKMLPRTCTAMYNKVQHIKVSEREPGDLIFFKADPSSSKITHVGIYCGVYHGPNKKFEGRRVFISEVSDGPATGVQLQDIDKGYWKSHFYAYGRILPATPR